MPNVQPASQLIGRHLIFKHQKNRKRNMALAGIRKPFVNCVLVQIKIFPGSAISL